MFCKITGVPGAESTVPRPDFQDWFLHQVIWKLGPARCIDGRSLFQAIGLPIGVPQMFATTFFPERFASSDKHVLRKSTFSARAGCGSIGCAKTSILRPVTSHLGMGICVHFMSLSWKGSRHDIKILSEDQERSTTSVPATCAISHPTLPVPCVASSMQVQTSSIPPQPVVGT